MESGWRKGETGERDDVHVQNQSGSTLALSMKHHASQSPNCAVTAKNAISAIDCAYSFDCDRSSREEAAYCRFRFDLMIELPDLRHVSGRRPDSQTGLRIPASDSAVRTSPIEFPRMSNQLSTVDDV
jgi:hypothetical protein